MKIALLGATGRTGTLLLERALENGHDVIAIVRNPAKVTIKHERLQVVEGNVFSDDSLSSHLTGVDAVLSCLGVTHTKKTTFYSDSAKAVVSAMRKANVTRFVVMSSWCTSYNRSDPGPWMWEWIYKPMFLKNMFADMVTMETYLKSEECKDINYTIVKPPRLLNSRSKGKHILEEEERQFVQGGKGKAPREDVAKFMLITLSVDKYDGKMIAIDCAK